MNFFEIICPLCKKEIQLDSADVRSLRCLECQKKEKIKIHLRTIVDKVYTKTLEAQLLSSRRKVYDFVLHPIKTYRQISHIVKLENQYWAFSKKAFNSKKKG